jgi:glycerol uptake facilitator-like aquaporin
LAAVVAGIVYVLALAVFGGFGGKLGTIAASGCAFTGICLSTEFTHPAVPKWNVGTLLVITGVVAALVTYYLNNNRKQGPVLASAVVGLVAGVLLPALYKDAGQRQGESLYESPGYSHASA